MFATTTLMTLLQKWCAVCWVISKYHILVWMILIGILIFLYVLNTVIKFPLKLINGSVSYTRNVFELRCCINKIIFKQLRFVRKNVWSTSTKRYPEYIDQPICNGTESHINNCTYFIPYSCSYNGDYVRYAKVECTGKITLTYSYEEIFTGQNVF
jgi:hypothetical protein